jgi:cation:H+ antiporter
VTSQAEDLQDVKPARQRVSLALAVALTLPGIVIRLAEPDLAHWAAALFFGMAIIGSAFLLAWAAEVAQLDISAGLAIALLALIAVLPEYAVDFVFAGKAGHNVAAYGPSCVPPGSTDASPCSLALANMTGSNRLLIGIGWSMVVFIAWWQFRRRGTPRSGITLERSHAIELTFLTLATAYSLTIPLRSTISLLDSAVLVSIFGLYIWRIAQAPAEEPHLVGPARYIGTFSKRNRRTTTVVMMAFAAGIILLCAEHFAESLVRAGADLGVSQFLLVQWVAPLASEAPELLVAGLYAYRLNTNAALGTLVSAKVNQWTLLVGTLPIVFAIASSTTHGLPIDAAQREELFLTAAQSAFAIAILANLSISIREALALFGLFWAQFLLGAVVPASMHGAERVIVGVVYLVLAAGLLLKDRSRLPQLVRDGFHTPHLEMQHELEMQGD